jgi:hypothetical protein
MRLPRCTHESAEEIVCHRESRCVRSACGPGSSPTPGPPGVGSRCTTHAQIPPGCALRLLVKTEMSATTAISGGPQRKGIRTWHFLRNLECYCVLDCGCPAIFRRRRSFFLGFARARRRRGGSPPPLRYFRSCWAGEGLWACQKGQIGQTMVCFGQLGAARSRQDELIERRPEEQGGELAFKGVFSVGFPASLLGGFPCDSGPLNGRKFTGAGPP